MTYSHIETTMFGLASWLAANFPTYVARANLGNTTPTAPLPNGYTFSPQIKTERLPWVLVNLDSFTREPSGQGAQNIRILASINILLTMSPPESISSVLARYCDALVDCLGSDESLGGLCTLSSLTDVDKYEEPAGDKARGYVAATLEMTIESLCR